MRQKPTDPELRARALEIAEDHGAAEASRQTGVPPGTIRAWRSRAGTVDPPPGADPMDWAAKRRQGAQTAWEGAQAALAKVQTLLKQGKPGPAQQAAVTAGILLDKSAALVIGAEQAEERQVSLAEAEGKLLADVLEQTFTDLGIPQTRAVRKLVAGHLRNAEGELAAIPADQIEQARREIREAIAPQPEPVPPSARAKATPARIDRTLTAAMTRTRSPADDSADSGQGKAAR